MKNIQVVKYASKLSVLFSGLGKRDYKFLGRKLGVQVTHVLNQTNMGSIPIDLNKFVRKSVTLWENISVHFLQETVITLVKTIMDISICLQSCPLLDYTGTFLKNMILSIWIWTFANLQLKMSCNPTEKMRKPLTSEFKIYFGYPRTETFSTCNALRVQIEACQSTSEQQRLEKELESHTL